MSPLDRDELAARVLVAMAPLREGTAADLAREAFDLAEALNTRAARLKPAPAPSLADAEWRDAPRAPYVPKVGDVVTWGSPGRNGAWVVVGPVKGGGVPAREISGNTHAVLVTTGAWAFQLRYLRPATAAERVAAGLDAAPASKPVDREGLRRAICDAFDAWKCNADDDRASEAVACDVVFSYLAANGGAS